MKNITRCLLYPLVLIGVLFIITFSCKKEDDFVIFPIQFNPDLIYGTIKDIDGNVYKTITIGTQTWMAENLKVTKYRNGDPILNITGGNAYDNPSTGAYYNYDNGTAPYGRLYNWYAVNDNRNIAPNGWHVPSDVEWTTLTDYLGGDSIAGSKLRESDTTHWLKPNIGATNESGFTGLPGGMCEHSMSFNIFAGLGYYGFFWSSTNDSTRSAWCRRLYYLDNYMRKDCISKAKFFSVRCVRD
jgi:uncharacterized protein (TIGR02145 family)